MMTGELDISKGVQKPMSPTHFHRTNKVYTFGIPHIEFSLSTKKKRSLTSSRKASKSKIYRIP